MDLAKISAGARVTDLPAHNVLVNEDEGASGAVPLQKPAMKLEMLRIGPVTDRIGHVVADFPQFGNGNVFEPFSLPVQSFVDLDRGLLHAGVRVLAPAPQLESLLQRLLHVITH